jgi:hypothetical protein
MSLRIPSAVVLLTWLVLPAASAAGATRTLAAAPSPVVYGSTQEVSAAVDAPEPVVLAGGAGLTRTRDGNSVPVVTACPPRWCPPGCPPRPGCLPAPTCGPLGGACGVVVNVGGSCGTRGVRPSCWLPCTVPGAFPCRPVVTTPVIRPGDVFHGHGGVTLVAAQSPVTGGIVIRRK